MNICEAAEKFPVGMKVRYTGLRALHGTVESASNLGATAVGDHVESAFKSLYGAKQVYIAVRWSDGTHGSQLPAMLAEITPEKLYTQAELDAATSSSYKAGRADAYKAGKREGRLAAVREARYLLNGMRASI